MPGADGAGQRGGSQRKAETVSEVFPGLVAAGAVPIRTPQVGKVSAEVKSCVRLTVARPSWTATVSVATSTVRSPRVWNQVSVSDPVAAPWATTVTVAVVLQRPAQASESRFTELTAMVGVTVRVGRTVGVGDGAVLAGPAGVAGGGATTGPVDGTVAGGAEDGGTLPGAAGPEDGTAEPGGSGGRTVPGVPAPGGVPGDVRPVGAAVGPVLRPPGPVEGAPGDGGPEVGAPEEEASGEGVAEGSDGAGLGVS